MYTVRTCHRRHVWIGVLLFLIGFCGEGVSGILLLQRGDLELLLLHFCAGFIWAFSINLLCNPEAPQGGPTPNRRTFVNKWGIGALLLGLFTFPGSGTLTYSVALALAALLQRKRETAPSSESAQTPENITVSEVVIQPTIKVLPDADIETKRLAVATLSRQGTPEALQVLRQLLLDPHAQIRSDASIALTHLEEKLSRSLKGAIEQWMKNPSDRERMLNLANEYYQYIQSNVLDEASQHFYLIKAHDLLQRVTTQDATEPDLWLKLARICQRLDKYEEALQDVRVALQLGLHALDAYLLAMELAFSLRDWESLVAFANECVSTLPETSAEISEFLRWWATPQAQQHGELIHA